MHIIDVFHEGELYTEVAPRRKMSCHVSCVLKSCSDFVERYKRSVLGLLPLDK